MYRSRSVAMSQMPLTASSEYTAPVGLDGLLTMIACVLGVMSDCISFGSGEKSFSILSEYSTALPPARATSGPYMMNPGLGTSASSPSPMMVSQAMRIPSVAPAVTMMFSAATSFL